MLLYCLLNLHSQSNTTNNGIRKSYGSTKQKISNQFTTKEYKIFLERTLLPTINFVPTSHAYSMRYILETILNVSFEV